MYEMEENIRTLDLIRGQYSKYIQELNTIARKQSN